METVSERLGHTNAAMTQNIYAPDSEERTRAVVDKVYADREAAVDEAA